MTWLMEISNIQIEEQLLIKYYVIKHSVLLKIQNMMDINVDLLQCFINFLIKKTLGETVKNENIFNKELAEDYTKQLLKDSRKEKYNHLL